MTKFEKIILLAVCFLIIVALVFGVIIFRQQKTIDSFMGKTGVASIQTTVRQNNPSLSEIIKQFSGTIENVSGKQVIVNVTLTDFSKPKDPDKFKNSGEPINFTADDFEILEKKITVNTNGKTVFEKKPLAELKVGDTVSVSSEKSPYTSNTVNAEKVSSGMPR